MKTVHYLTLEELEIQFEGYISKKELKAQSIGTCITVNDQQIVILPVSVSKKDKIKNDIVIDESN